MANGNKVSPASAIRLANTIGNQLGINFKVTADNWANFSNIITGDPFLRNQYVTALWDRIGVVTVKRASSTDEYEELYEHLESPTMVEERFYEMPKAREFDPNSGDKYLFKKYLPDVKSVYHQVNLEIQYQATMQADQAIAALETPEATWKFFEEQVDLLYRAAIFDRMILLSTTLGRALLEGNATQISVEDDPVEIAKAINTYASKSRYANPAHNTAGVHNGTRPEEMVVFVTPENRADITAKLATIYHVSDVEIKSMIREIPSFEDIDEDRMSMVDSYIPLTTEQKTQLGRDVVAFMAPRDYFKMYKVLDKSTSFNNPATLTDQHYLTIKYILGTSPFENAFVFTKQTVTEPESFEMQVTRIDTNPDAGVVEVTLGLTRPLPFFRHRVKLISGREEDTAKGIHVGEYGTITFSKTGTTTLKAKINNVGYTAATTLGNTAGQTTKLTFNKG